MAAEPHLANPVAFTIPLYVRSGAIVPVQVRGDVTGLGTAESADELTVLIWPSASTTSFTVLDEDGAETTISVTGATVTVEGDPRPMVFRVRSAATSRIVLGGIDVAEAASRDEVLATTADAWFHDAPTRMTWVRLGSAGAGASFVVVP